MSDQREEDSMSDSVGRGYFYRIDNHILKQSVRDNHNIYALIRASWWLIRNKIDRDLSLYVF